MSIDIASTERVVGFEMEYPASVYQKNLLTGEIDQNSGPFIVPVLYKKYKHTSNGFLEITFRAYKDGQLDEIATPECYPDSVGVVQLASEELAINALQEVVAKKNSASQGYHFLLPLRVGNESSNSGYHENYQLLNPAINKKHETMDFYKDFSATEGVWNGQGMYSAVDGRFSLIQKSRLFSNRRGLHGAVVLKPISVPVSRMEFRRRNYPLSYWQLKHRAAYTSAVMRYAELENPLPAEFKKSDDDIRIEAAYNIWAPIETQNRKVTTPVEYQFKVAEKVLKYASNQGFPDYEVRAAEAVLKVLTSLIEKREEKVINEVPWVAKLGIILSYVPDFLDRRLTKTEANLAKSLCVAIDSRGKGGLVDTIRNKQDSVYSQAEILKAMSSPPCLAVATRRGNRIKQTQVPSIFNGMWLSSTLKAYKQPSRTIPG